LNCSPASAATYCVHIDRSTCRDVKTTPTTTCVSSTKADSTRATDASVDDFSLSRWSDVDYQQLVSRSTHSSYGHVGHSQARHNISIRATIDESNTFFYKRTSFDDFLAIYCC
jgi:hypothetical protein